jgi:hypothetical protein
VEYIFVIHQVTDIKLIAKSFPWTVVLLAEYDIAKTINFNDVIEEFSSVKARKVTS